MKMCTVAMMSNGITFAPNFVKICQLVQKLKVTLMLLLYVYADRQTDSLKRGNSQQSASLDVEVCQALRHRVNRFKPQ